MSAAWSESTGQRSITCEPCRQIAWREPEKIEMPASFMEEILRTGTRGTSENFIRRQPGSEEMIYSTSRVVQTWEPVAVVRENGERLLVEVRNTLHVGTEVEYMRRGIETERGRIVAMHDASGMQLAKANPGNLVSLTLEPPLVIGETNGILRRKREENG